MTSKIIKASLVNDRGIWTVRARFADTIGGKVRLHAKSTGYSVSGRNKRKAEEKMREIVTAWEKKISGQTVLNDEITFGECANHWLDVKSASIKESTAEFYRICIQKHISKNLGSIRLKDLTRLDIQNYFNSLAAELSSNTLRKHLVVINGALEEAVLNGWLLSDTGNVLKMVTLPKKEKFEGKCLTEEQMKTVLSQLSSAKEPIHTAVVLGLYYGLRRSEICGLRWEDVDFRTGMIHIRNTVTDYGGLIIEEERTKTLKSRRNIQMIADTVDYFKTLYDRRIAQGMVSNKVCAYENGRAAMPEYISRHVKEFLAECGAEGMRLHDLRHTAASVLVKRLPVVLVSDFLGHSSVSTTLNVYSHMLDEERSIVSNEMSTYLGSLRTSTK